MYLSIIPGFLHTIDLEIDVIHRFIEKGSLSQRLGPRAIAIWFGGCSRSESDRSRTRCDGILLSRIRMLGKRQMFPPKHGTDETFQLVHPGDESVEIPKVSVSS
jgi:hypothetical protein